MALWGGLAFLFTLRGACLPDIFPFYNFPQLAATFIFQEPVDASEDLRSSLGLRSPPKS